MNDKQDSFAPVDPAHERARQTKKWNTYGEQVLPLWVAEMDFPAAPPVIEAITDATRRQEFGYPLGDLDTGLPKAFCQWSRHNHGWAPVEERVHLVPDVLSGVSLSIEHFTPKGTPVILPTPAYMPFFEVPKAIGRPIIEVPMVIVEGRWELDLEGIDRAFSEGGTSLILCQPYNPLGRLFTKEELVALSEVVERHGGRVASDEIHAPLTYDSPHIPYASVNDLAAGHTVTTTSASKAWNLPGLKCAQVFTSNDRDEDTWQKISYLHVMGASTFGIRSNIAAYIDGREWLEQVREQIRHNRALLAKLLTQHIPQARYAPPEATYLAWIDFSELSLDEEPADFFLREAGVAMNAGPAFGGNGAGHCRLNLATSPQILEQAIERMSTALAQRGE